MEGTGRILISPSMLSADFAALKEEVQSLEAAGADMLHIDVMDGMFVPNITFGACVMRALSRVSRLPLDVHMMVEQPERYLEDMVEAGAHIVTVHAEATKHLHRALQRIAELGAVPGVSINPGTPASCLESVLSDVGLVLIMTVNPGFGGQKLIPSALEKVKVVRGMLDRRRSQARLEVDGGVTVDNAGEFLARGADTLVSGTAIFSAKDRGEAIRRMRGGLAE